MSDYKIVLASQSPRRKEILGKLGIDFEVIVSELEEKTSETEPAEIVKDLSKQKARAVFDRIQGDYEKLAVIGSDTVVAHKGDIMGKPKNREDAYRMIRSFAGDTHYVFSGVTVIVKDVSVNSEMGCLQNSGESYISSDSNSVACITFGVGTAVEVDNMTDDEIYSYIDTGEPFDKAGAYAIQGLFAPYVKSISGDYYNIVGLPLNELYRVLKELKIV